ncbi:MAG: YfcE family phosphodiesterase [Treponema sp.]|nr:YfcE family phosphodiesterase [Treponema sp.]
MLLILIPHFSFFLYNSFMDTRRLLALSDTHGHISALETVLDWVKDNYTVDTVVFLGDGIDDLRRTPMTKHFPCEWVMVRGNNDFGFSLPETVCLDWRGHRFFACHGHRHALYRNNDTLVAAARGMEADVVLFGHAHVPSCENTRGILLVNPGSIGRPRSRIGASFAIIESLPEQALDVRFWGFGLRGEIKEISP